MFSTLVFACVAGYGIKKVASFAKENPEKSTQAMLWLRKLLSK